MQDTGTWSFGGSAELFPGLTWESCPDMTGSEASEDLQRAWCATIMAIQAELGAVKNGNCFLINMTAAPLAQEVLGEPVSACAGYAGFVERTGRSEFGMRWRPDKWRDWIDAKAGAHVSPLQDIHVWLETRTHVIDFTMGDTMGESGDLWPPLINWPKWRFPKHPREARAPGSILLWKNAKALETVAPLAPLVLPLTARAFEIYSELEQRERCPSNTQPDPSISTTNLPDATQPEPQDWR